MSRSTEHKEGKATVKVVYYKHKTLSDGSHPFVVRITKNRKNRWVSTGQSLHPRYWNDERNEVRRSYPHDKRQALEATLKKWEVRYSDAADSLAMSDEVHDVKAVASKVSDERKINSQFQLLAYMDDLASQMLQSGQVGNRKVYREIRLQLTKYIQSQYNKEDIPFDQVTVKFCNGWETFMRKSGLTEITLSVKFRTLRAVLNKAIANGYAKAEYYPFARNAAEKYKFHIGKFDTSTSKRAINRAEIRKIEEYEPTGATKYDVERLQLAKDVFLFSYFCGGINFVDIAALRWSNIASNLNGHQRLSYIRQKTGGRFSFRLVPPALAILDCYRSGPGNSFNEYIFPILNDALHKTPLQIHNRCNKVMGHINSGLKEIAEVVGITTLLTTYVARHSFATTLKHSGVATGIISELMGHKTEAVTQTYLASFDSDLIDEAFENLL
ncbi:site-specific integrase [Larkinella punicea]|uniref:Site-specific integrase n=1 Tax=Larkinella punicea TaxID=2315727 RepID=A0A368JUY4_9BACT|nr:site-specific integrase [Larkinella punicea]RCR71272.1 site-specific integrase [Larkinella punicea]